MKKAQIVTVKNLILVLIIAIILIVFVGKVTQFMSRQTTVETCRLSVLAAAKSKVLVKPLVDSIKCKTRQIEITDKAILLNKKKIETFNINNIEETKNKIKRTIADEMYIAWYQFGQGKLNPYGDFEGGSKCMISTQIRFDKSFNEKIPKIEGIGTYLEDTPVPTKNFTYLEFLINGKVEKDLNFVQKMLAKEGIEGADFIDTSKLYYTLFVVDSSSTALLAAGGIIGGCVVGSVIPFVGTAIGCVAGGFGGGIWLSSAQKEGLIYLITVLLIPADQLKTVCDSLEA